MRAKLSKVADKHPIIAFFLFEFIVLFPWLLRADKYVCTVSVVLILILYFLCRYTVFKIRRMSKMKLKLVVEFIFAVAFDILIIALCNSANDILYGIFALCAVLPTVSFEVMHNYGKKAN